MVGVTRSTSFVDTGLTASTAYSYTVSAYDKASPTNSGLPTAPVIATTLASGTTTPVTTAARDDVKSSPVGPVGRPCSGDAHRLQLSGPARARFCNWR